MKRYSIVASAILFFFSVTLVQAKVLPRYSKSTTTAKTSATATSANSIGSAVKFMSGKTGVILSFSNLTAAKSVSYTLSYTTNGKAEGVVGSMPTTSKTGSRELLFGTCSSGVCKYHKNITNATLTVNSTLTNGKKTTKRYKLKI